jgi:hypothetical protein
MTTWSDVSDATSTWNGESTVSTTWAVKTGYVLDGYIVDDVYVIGGSSGTGWDAASTVSSSWSAASAASTTWSAP